MTDTLSAAPPAQRLAGALLLNERRRLLLLHRNVPDAQWWEVPGGKQSAGEFPYPAARREILEELGVFVDSLIRIGAANIESGTDRRLYYTWFVAPHWVGVPRVMEPHLFDQLGWFTLAQVRRLAPSPSLRILLSTFEEALRDWVD